MQIIDTHCHPHFNKYDSDPRSARRSPEPLRRRATEGSGEASREEMISRAQNAGVGMLCVGVDLESSRKEIEIASAHENMWASVGLHPNDNLYEEYNDMEYEMLAQHPKVVAIGEVGLDYYRTTDDAKKKFQKERFLKQIDLAIRLNKPLIIHCRDPVKLPVGDHGASAHDDMIEILSTLNSQLSTSPRGVIHSFTGTYENAQKYIELGFCIGLNGIITFSRDYDETVKNIPLESILLETDAPFLAPLPYRGQRNEPAYIIEVAKKLAEMRGISLDKVSEVTTANAKRLFQL